MRKLSILMTALFCVGTAGLVWADDLNPQPLPPGVTSTGGDSGTQMRKAGGDPNSLTLHDQNQINGNLNGDGKTGNSLNKQQSFKKAKGTTKKGAFIKYSNKNSKGKSKVETTGGSGAGKTKITGNSALNNGTKAGLNFTHGNGLQKPGMGDGGALPAVQPAH